MPSWPSGHRCLKNRLRDIKDIPLIYAMAMPSETSPFRQPNISGVSMDLSPAAYLAAMGTLFPGKRIGILYDPQNTGAYVEDAGAGRAGRGDRTGDEAGA